MRFPSSSYPQSRRPPPAGAQQLPDLALPRPRIARASCVAAASAPLATPACLRGGRRRPTQALMSSPGAPADAASAEAVHRRAPQRDPAYLAAFAAAAPAGLLLLVLILVVVVFI